MNAIIFDMDGVLFDTERLAVRAWDAIGVKMHLGKLGYMVYKTLGRTREESVKIFRQEFGTRFNNDVFQQYYKDYLSAYYAEHPVPMKNGLKELLHFLKENGYKIAVASSSKKEEVMHHLISADILSNFDAIVCGDMITQSKPEPDIYLAAAKALQQTPQECFAVEDSRSGLLSAHRAGCKVIYIPDIYKADEETLSVVELQFTNLMELKDYLMR